MAAVLRSTNDEMHAPGELVAHAMAIDEKTLTRVREEAFFSGRVIERTGAAVLGCGVAAYVALDGGLAPPDAPEAVLACLRTIAADSTSATPLALGALGFDASHPARLVVPELTVHVGEGEPTMVFIAPPGQLDARIAHWHDVFERAVSPVRAVAPDQFDLSSTESHAAFMARVEHAVAAIHRGEFEKVVLVREVDVRANEPFTQGDLLGRMRVLHPSCAAFALDGFLGASPELLCRRRGVNVESQPLAGTIPRSGDPQDDEAHARAFLSSEKERSEHAFVDAIARGLAPYCADVVVPPTPHLLELRNVVHLATSLSATLKERDGRLACALELVRALHPTPAVGGSPRPAALAYLAAHEKLERDRFAGPVGWMDANGDGEWWLGIRSAIVDGREARLFAGVGIVADSDPQSELVETQLKLQAFLATAVRP